MNNFEIIQKSNVFFGAGEEKKIGRLVKQYAEKCLLVTPRKDTFESLIDQITGILEEEGITVYELSGVVANPSLSFAEQGIELVRKNQIGFVLALGGGSVMDTAKYISIATYYDGDPLKINLSTEIKTKVIPHGTIVTLSGSGSELSNVLVIVDDTSGAPVKKVLMNNDLFFDFSVVNPELTYSLPEKQLSAGVMDGISHCLESYDANDSVEPIFEGYYESIINTLLVYGPKALEDQTNYNYRSKISLATMIANNQNFCTSGVIRDLSVHNIESPITTATHGTHGVILGVITPAFIQFTYKRNPYPFVNLMVRCFGVDPLDKTNDKIIEEGICRMKSWMHLMKLPISLGELGISFEDAINCFPEDYIAGKVYKLNKSDICQILKYCE